jgi:type VI secretion system protein ImpH
LNAPHGEFPLSIGRPLLPRILQDATRMAFYRFCALIEQSAPDGPALGATESPATDPVRFRSRARLGFPSREIDAVEYGGSDPDDASKAPVVRTTFHGLYGVGACMPPYFIDEIALDGEGANALAAFLDLFHHRFVTQYYRVWRKYRYPAGFRTGGADDISRYLLSLVGLGIGKPPLEQTVGTRQLLSMLGLASQRTRTAEGLAAILRHAVPDARITVIEFHPVWVESNDAGVATLGENCVLGRGFYDRANTVRVIVEPQMRETVLESMPGGAAHAAIMALLRFYLGYAGNAHLEMHIAPRLMPEPVVSSRQVSLGYTTQLRQACDGHVTRVHLGMWNGAPAQHRPKQACAAH